MENQPKIMSTLVNAQKQPANEQVQGFCGTNYSSNGGGTSCGSSYSSSGGGTSSTSEELEILI